MQKQLIIAGFHRSGTSMLAQELNNAGLFLGDRLMAPGISNADGHYEDMDFFTFHEKILRSHHANWQYASDESLDMPQLYESDMHRIIQSRNKQHEQWGFKDPRTTLFLDQWYEQLDNPYTVVIYRHYEECVNSLLHRAAGSIVYNQSPDISFWEDPTLAYRMWLSYNKKIIAHVKKYPKTCIVVSQNAILEGFPIVQTVSEKFGFNLNPTMKSAVKKSLLSPLKFQHFTLDCNLLNELEETWQILEELSLAPSNVDIQNSSSMKKPTLDTLDEKLEVLGISHEMDSDPVGVALETLASNDMELKEKIVFIKKQRPLFRQFRKIELLIDSLQVLLAKHPEETELYFLLSDICIVEKQYDVSELLLLKVFSVTKQIAPFYYMQLSNLYLKKNDLDTAQYYIDKAIIGNPLNPSFYATSAMIAYERCQYDVALSKFEKAININKENTYNPNADLNFQFKRIDILNELGKTEEVKNMFTYLDEQFPSDERVTKKHKNIFQIQEKIDASGKIKELENKLSLIQDDPYYYTKLITLWKNLDNDWAREDLLDRVIYYFDELNIEKNVGQRYQENKKEAYIFNNMMNLKKVPSQKEKIIKTIYILWLQGFDDAPVIVKKCLQSWKKKNPTWNIVELDELSLKKYINIDKEIDGIQLKTISKASLSDIIRISLLKKYGGLWVDATTYCTRPLDDWLENYIVNGFFAFNFEKNLEKVPDRPIASWFLYGDKNNYIIDSWYKKTIQYCQKTSIIGVKKTDSTKDKWIDGELEKHYFWFHYLFEDLYKSNLKFKNIWINTPKFSEKYPHFIQHNGMLNNLSDSVKSHIDLKKSPLYKLTYRYNEEKYNNTCNLYYLLQPIYSTMNIASTIYEVKDCIPNIHFIHIGKCGGTALLFAFKDQEIKLNDFHLKKPIIANADDKYIIWIRNPLHRFISAFNFSLALINTDTSELDQNNLTIHNCLAPARIRYKMNNNHTFSEEYDDLVVFFQTPNNLAEALSSTNINIKNKALKLMNYPMEHINKGLGWYLNNGDFIRKNSEKILFVGKIETIKTDIVNLSKILDIPLNIKKGKIRENSIYVKYLSTLAVENLLEFYKNTDYKALEELHRQGWIDNNTYQSYFKY